MVVGIDRGKIPMEERRVRMVMKSRRVRGLSKSNVEWQLCNYVV